VQPDQLGVGCQGPGLQLLELIAGSRGVFSHAAGGIDHPFQQWRQVFDRSDLGNLPRAFLQVILEVRARLIHHRQLIDEGRQHLAHCLLRFQGAALCLSLSADDILQAALDVVQAAEGDGGGHGTDERIDLALDALLIEAQLADVVDDQMQQLQQGLLDLPLFLGRQRGPLAEAGEQGQQRLEVHCRAFESFQQLERLAGQPLVLVAECRQQVFDQARDSGQQLAGMFWRFAFGRALCFRSRPLLRGRCWPTRRW